MKITIDVRDYREACVLARLAHNLRAIEGLRAVIDRLIEDDARLRMVVDQLMAVEALVAPDRPYDLRGVGRPTE